MRRFNIFPIALLMLLGLGFSSVRSATPLMQIALSPEDSVKVAASSRQSAADVDVDSIMSILDYLDPDDSEGTLLQIEAVDYQPVRAAIILDDIYGKKEMDFSRGFIYGLHKIGMPDNSVALKMVNGGIPADSLVWSLETFQPDVIFTTLDNGCPPAIIDYAGDHSTKIVNVFDTRSDSYSSSPSLVQVLIPSQKFNASSALYLSDSLGGGELVMVGEIEDNDALLKQLLQVWPGENQVSILRDDIPSYKYEPGKKYVFYVTSSSQADIKESLKNITALVSKYPDINFEVIGRPSWIAINDLSKAISGLNVYVPAKCFFDVATAKESRWFIPEFKEMFGSAPIKSYPIYSIMGFDMAKYFMPQIYNEINNIGSTHWPDAEELQLNIVLVNDNWYSGQYNAGSYIINYSPDGKITKIPVRAN